MKVRKCKSVKGGLTILSHFLTFTLSHFQATVAQLVEQVIRNDQVAGSKPVGGSEMRDAEQLLLVPGLLLILV